MDNWLKEDPYENFPWRCCCKIPVRALLKKGSDEVDGTPGGQPSLDPIGFALAQSSENAYQHAMRSPTQSIASAKAKYDAFLSENISQARSLANLARNGSCASLSRAGGYPYACAKITDAVRILGHAYHAYSDSLSPAHSGFQPWYGPVDGLARFGQIGYELFVKTHHDAETMAQYDENRPSIDAAIKRQFQSILDDILPNSQ